MCDWHHVAVTECGDCDARPVERSNILMVFLFILERGVVRVSPVEGALGIRGFVVNEHVKGAAQKMGGIEHGKEGLEERDAPLDVGPLLLFLRRQIAGTPRGTRL